MKRQGQESIYPYRSLIAHSVPVITKFEGAPFSTAPTIARPLWTANLVIGYNKRKAR